MRRVNFLANAYRLEPVRNDKEAGICDPACEKPAYSTADKDSPDKWIATIKNPERKDFQFVPVDKNIVTIGKMVRKSLLAMGWFYIMKAPACVSLN